MPRQRLVLVRSQKGRVPECARDLPKLSSLVAETVGKCLRSESLAIATILGGCSTSTALESAITHAFDSGGAPAQQPAAVVLPRPRCEFSTTSLVLDDDLLVAGRTNNMEGSAPLYGGSILHRDGGLGLTRLRANAAAMALATQAMSRRILPSALVGDHEGWTVAAKEAAPWSRCTPWPASPGGRETPSWDGAISTLMLAPAGAAEVDSCPRKPVTPRAAERSLVEAAVAVARGEVLARMPRSGWLLGCSGPDPPGALIPVTWPLGHPTAAGRAPPRRFVPLGDLEAAFPRGKPLRPGVTLVSEDGEPWSALTRLQLSRKCAVAARQAVLSPAVLFASSRSSLPSTPRRGGTGMGVAVSASRRSSPRARSGSSGLGAATAGTASSRLRGRPPSSGVRGTRAKPALPPAGDLERWLADHAGSFLRGAARAERMSMPHSAWHLVPEALVPVPGAVSRSRQAAMGALVVMRGVEPKAAVTPAGVLGHGSPGSSAGAEASVTARVASRTLPGLCHPWPWPDDDPVDDTGRGGRSGSGRDYLAMTADALAACDDDEGEGCDPTPRRGRSGGVAPWARPPSALRPRRRFPAAGHPPTRSCPARFPDPLDGGAVGTSLRSGERAAAAGAPAAVASSHFPGREVGAAGGTAPRSHKVTGPPSPGPSQTSESSRRSSSVRSARTSSAGAGTDGSPSPRGGRELPAPGLSRLTWEPPGTPSPTSPRAGSEPSPSRSSAGPEPSPAAASVDRPGSDAGAAAAALPVPWPVFVGPLSSVPGLDRAVERAFASLRHPVVEAQWMATSPWQLDCVAAAGPGRARALRVVLLSRCLPGPSSLSVDDLRRDMHTAASVVGPVRLLLVLDRTASQALIGAPALASAINAVVASLADAGVDAGLCGADPCSLLAEATRWAAGCDTTMSLGQDAASELELDGTFLGVPVNLGIGLTPMLLQLLGAGCATGAELIARAAAAPGASAAGADVARLLQEQGGAGEPPDEAGSVVVRRAAALFHAFLVADRAEAAAHAASQAAERRLTEARLRDLADGLDRPAHAPRPPRHGAGGRASRGKPIAALRMPPPAQAPLAAAQPQHVASVPGGEPLLSLGDEGMVGRLGRSRTPSAARRWARARGDGRARSRSLVRRHPLAPATRTVASSPAPLGPGRIQQFARVTVSDALEHGGFDDDDLSAAGRASPADAELTPDPLDALRARRLGLVASRSASSCRGGLVQSNRESMPGTCPSAPRPGRRRDASSRQPQLRGWLRSSIETCEWVQQVAGSRTASLRGAHAPHGAPRVKRRDAGRLGRLATPRCHGLSLGAAGTVHQPCRRRCAAGAVGCPDLFLPPLLEVPLL